jgi:hypothetical protein
MTSGRRLGLFALEVALGLVYLAAFAVFVTQSRDFLVVRDNQQAAAAARATTPVLPGTFEFGARQADNALLGIDWWSFEEGDEGIWSKARPYIYLPVPADAGGVQLSIDGDLFVAPGHETVGMTLTIDGLRAAEWTAIYGHPEPAFAVSVPGSAAADGLLELRLDIANPAVPLHFGDPAEKREVGLLLRSVTLQAN